MNRAAFLALAPSVALAAALGALAGCESATAARADPAPDRPQPLRVVPVVERPLDTTIHLNGDLLPYQSVALYARVSAFVSTVEVDRGSHVRKGARLATLVAPELSAQRAEAEATARAHQRTSDRLNEAAKTPGAVAGNEVETASAAAASSKAKVEALAALERYLAVEAPFDGVITDRDVHPGALVGPNSAKPMLKLEEQSRLRLMVPVPEPLVAMVVADASVPFTVRSRPGETFRGIIRRSAQSIDVRTRTMAVELDVDNADGKLAPGMFAEIAWPVRRTTPSLFVPDSAVMDSAERTFVARVKDGVVEQVPVKRGWSSGGMTEVFGELARGDQVVRQASDEHRSGTRATVVVDAR